MQLPPDLSAAVLQSRKQFIAAAADVRPRLHRFCARMCGTAFDDEDVVQEVLAEAFYNIASLKDPLRFEPWLFRIAYHRRIGFIRRERRRSEDVAFEESTTSPAIPSATPTRSTTPRSTTPSPRS